MVLGVCVCVCECVRMDSAAGARLTGRKTMMDDGRVFTAATCKCHRGVHKASSTPNYRFLEKEEEGEVPS